MCAPFAATVRGPNVAPLRATTIAGTRGDATAGAATSVAAPARTRVALADNEDDPVATAAARIVAVERLVDRVDVEHVAPARQRARQQVAPVGRRADAEPLAVRRAAAGGPEALELAREVRAPAVVVAGQAQLDHVQAGG